MGVGTKHRQQQTADSCKRHLREKYEDDLALVEEFIQEIEGTGKNRDIVRWSQFTDASQNQAEMLRRLDGYFEKWLNP